MKLVTTLSVLALLASCAHDPKPVAISNPEGPMAEITKQEELIASARESHVNVLAPKEFEGAKEALEEAREELAEKSDEKKIYEELGVSKAYLNNANAIAVERTEQMKEILTAREAALKAGAADNAKDLKSADAAFMAFTANADDFKEMNSTDKKEMQDKYLTLELLAIKASRLGTVQRTLDEARAKGAPSLIPVAYNDAMEKFRAADLAITQNRHAENISRPAVTAASRSANNALALVETARQTQGMTPEERARTLQAKDKALQAADQLNAQATEEAMLKGDALAAQGAALNAVAGENSSLRRRELADKAVANAAAQFSDSEAEVYRQGDNLVIRLKQVNFPSGSANLPANSMPVLSKVKEVLVGLNPEAVVVEGHTDSVGSIEKNKTLSEKRAQAVAKYFESDAVLADNKFETEGFGDTKPLTTNKTKEGRAQNRRVDIVITPPAL